MLNYCEQRRMNQINKEMKGEENRIEEIIIPRVRKREQQVASKLPLHCRNHVEQ